MAGKLKDLLWKSSVRSVLCLALFGWGMFFFFPIRSGFIKAGMLLTVLAAWICVLILLWPKRKRRYVFLGLTAGAFFCCMPPRQINTAKLRAEYVRSLSRYEGRPYVWGAENYFAVDCSGLIRQGFIDADVLYGLKTCNGALLRQAILLWWFDASARAIRDEYRGLTKRVLAVPSINELDHNLILPGDFAVTQNGVHCLAYLGEGKWIQADPDPGRVIVGRTPEENAWYQTPVYIMRWSDFENMEK